MQHVPVAALVEAIMQVRVVVLQLLLADNNNNNSNNNKNQFKFAFEAKLMRVAVSRVIDGLLRGDVNFVRTSLLALPSRNFFQHSTLTYKKCI